jgi:hypothetical protein
MEKQQVMERIMAIFKADFEKLKDDQEGMTSAQKVYREKLMALFGANQGEKKANPEQMEPNPGEKEAVETRQETPNEEVAIQPLTICQDERTACQETTEARLEFQEPTSADMKACEQTTVCQDAMEANLVKMEPNPGEKEAAVERQETPNEEVAIYSLKECRNETMACQGTTEARLESESEHREVPNEDAIVKPVRGRKKPHRGRKQAAGRRGEPEELTRGDCRSREKLAAACRKVSRRATVAWRKRNIFRKSWK